MGRWVLLGLVLLPGLRAMAQPECNPEIEECAPPGSPNVTPPERTEPCDPTTEPCTGGASGSGGSEAGGAPSGGAGSGGGTSPDEEFPVPAVLEHAVDSQVDLVEQRPLVAFAHPFSVAGAARWSEGGEWLGGASFGTVVLRTGKTWGMTRLVPLDVTVWTGAITGPTAAAQVALAKFDEVYFCHNEIGPSFMPLPLLGLLPKDRRNCGHGEWFGYYGSVLDFAFQPDTAHVAGRFIELGLLANAFRTGRTDAVQRNRLVFRLGATFEYVDLGTTARPAGAWSTSALARGEAGAEFSVGTKDRRLRFVAKGMFLPRLGEWDDYQGTGETALSVYFPLEIVSVLEISAYGKFSYASLPWMSSSHWADLTQPWSVQPGLRFAFYWYDGR